MIRSTLLSIATLAAVASTASAGGYGYGYDYEYKPVTFKLVCHIEKVKVFVGYDAYYQPIFKWVDKKVCEKVYY